MANDNKKPIVSKPKNINNTWKAVNPEQFSEWFTKESPYYDDLSAGKSIEVDETSQEIQNWIDNKIIVKE